MGRRSAGAAVGHSILDVLPNGREDGTFAHFEVWSLDLEMNLYSFERGRVNEPLGIFWKGQRVSGRERDEIGQNLANLDISSGRKTAKSNTPERIRTSDLWFRSSKLT
jgi:hypothetical protein